MIPMATFLKSLRNLMVAGLKNTAGFLRQRVPSSIGELKAANLKNQTFLLYIIKQI